MSKKKYEVFRSRETLEYIQVTAESEEEAQDLATRAWKEGFEISIQTVDGKTTNNSKIGRQPAPGLITTYTKTDKWSKPEAIEL